MIELHCTECGARLADSESLTPPDHIYVCASHVCADVLPRRLAVQARATAVRGLLERHVAVTLSTRPRYGSES